MNKKILIIDNDKGVREIIADILIEEGYRVSTMSQEEDVFKHIIGFKPYKILLDIIRPRYSFLRNRFSDFSPDTIQHKHVRLAKNKY